MCIWAYVCVFEVVMKFEKNMLTHLHKKNNVKNNFRYEPYRLFTDLKKGGKDELKD